MSNALQTPTAFSACLRPRLKVTALLASLLIGCGLPGTPGTPDPADPAVGTKVTSQDVVGYFPAPRVGIRYVYTGVELKGQVTVSHRLDAEVAEINGNLVKLRLIVDGAASKLQDVDTSKPPVLPPGGLTFEGRENIAIPAGNFNAQKFSYSQSGGTVNIWALKGIGVLKVIDQKANRDTNTIILESYKN